MTKKTTPAYRASKEETIPINKLHPFSNHPFHILHDLEFSELVDSISESGIITPIIVRPKVGVGYEVISGHRRWEACKELGIESIPARVEYIDDDEATILMVNSNIQREHVLPSEKAFAYKMRMEALKQTNYVKSIVTAQDKMDLEKKGKQSYQGWMYARLLAFSNGDLQSLYDRSDGFYRRQLILTTKEKPAARKDDPDIAEKMCCELEGIFLWAFEGLQRLVRNQFRFSESERAKGNRDVVKQDANNVILFMESTQYVELNPNKSISSKELYAIYTIWCEENAFSPLKSRTVSDFLVGSAKKYGIEHSNNMVNAAGRRVWGFKGIGAVLHLNVETHDGWKTTWADTPFDYAASQ